MAAVRERVSDVVERIRERLDAWRETPVTTLLVAGQDDGALAEIAELVLG